MAISERSGLCVSQVADEVLYTGLIEMQELWEGGGGAHWPHPEIHETPALKNSSKRRNLIIYKTIS